MRNFSAVCNSTIFTSILNWGIYTVSKFSTINNIGLPFYEPGGQGLTNLLTFIISSLLKPQKLYLYDGEDLTSLMREDHRLCRTVQRTHHPSNITVNSILCLNPSAHSRFLPCCEFLESNYTVSVQEHFPCSQQTLTRDFSERLYLFILLPIYVSTCYKNYYLFI